MLPKSRVACQSKFTSCQVLCDIYCICLHLRLFSLIIPVGGVCCCICSTCSWCHNSDIECFAAGNHLFFHYYILFISRHLNYLTTVLLQGGHIIFFQSLSLLGYCLFPLDIGALICLLGINVIIKMMVVLVTFSWSSWAAYPFMSTAVSPRRKALALYPIFLMYVFVGCLVIAVDWVSKFPIASGGHTICAPWCPLFDQNSVTYRYGWSLSCHFFLFDQIRLFFVRLENTMTPPALNCQVVGICFVNFLTEEASRYYNKLQQRKAIWRLWKNYNFQILCTLGSDCYRTYLKALKELPFPNTLKEGFEIVKD